MANHERDEELESVLRECADDDERERLLRTWDRLSALDDAEPPAELVARFTSALRGASSAAAPTGARGWVLAASLTAGFLLGALAGVLVAPRPDAGRDIDRLERDLRAAHRALARATHPGATAAARLSAVDTMTAAAGHDAGLRNTLAALAAADRNLNVRIVAAQALGPHLDDPEVAASLARVLETADDPQISIVLLDLLVEGGVTSAIPVIERVRDDESADRLVREKARWATQILRRKRSDT